MLENGNRTLDPAPVSIHLVWSLTGERPMVTLHADLAAGANRREALKGIHRRLQECLEVDHVTVQIEEEGPCETPPCEPQPR